MVTVSRKLELSLPEAVKKCQTAGIIIRSTDHLHTLSLTSTQSRHILTTEDPIIMVRACRAACYI